MPEFQNPPISVENLPQFQKLDFVPLDRKYYWLCALETAVSWMFLFFVFTILRISVPDINIPLFVPLALIIPAVFSTLHSYQAARARGYILRKHDILAREGIWWQKRTGVSFKRIQHIDITHGPIERKLSLATIKFFTAGGAMADLKISGLEKHKAEAIRRFIFEKSSSLDD